MDLFSFSIYCQIDFLRSGNNLHSHVYRVPLDLHMWSLLVVNYLVGQGGLLNECLQLKIDQCKKASSIS